MTSLTRSFFFATLTTPPFGLYTPFSATGLDLTPPVFLTAVGKIVDSVLSLTTMASTPGFKWLSLGNFSRWRLNLHPTPTSPYYLEPTTTLLATGNCSLAIPPLIFFFSVLFGAGVVLGRRGTSSSYLFTVYRQKMPKKEHPSPKSLYSESPTLFHQQDTVLPSYMTHKPRRSSFWISALSFSLRGLAFFFRLICMEKLLDMVEDNSTGESAENSADNRIAELRALNRKLGRKMNNATPTQAVVSSARFPDANKTLVSPFSPLPMESKDEYHNLLPEDVKAQPPPASIEIDSASTRKPSVSPPGVICGATSVASLEGGEGSLPTSDTILAPVSVEPPVVPDTPSPPVYKSSYTSFKPNRLATGPSTLSRRNAAISLSVEPLRVPDIFVPALEPQAESSAQVEARPTRCLDSPQPSYSKLSNLALDVVPKSSPASIYQTKLRLIFQRCFDDLSNYSKPTAPISSFGPVNPTSGTDTGLRTNVSVEREEGPKNAPRTDVTAIHCTPENSRVQSTRDGLASTSGTEGIAPRPVIGTSQEDRREMDALKKILLSGRSSGVAELNRSHFETVKAMRENAREMIRRAREASAAIDLPRHTKYPRQSSAAVSENHLKSVDAIRENARGLIHRSQEAVAKLNMRIRTKYPAPQPQADKQPRCTRPESEDIDTHAVGEEMARDAREQIPRHGDLMAPRSRYQGELQTMTTSSRSQAFDNSYDSPGSLTDSEPEVSQEAPTTTQSRPSRELQHSTLSSIYLTPIKPGESQEDATIQSSPSRDHLHSTLPSESRPLAMSPSDHIARLHSLLEINVPVPDMGSMGHQGETDGPINQTDWPSEGYVRSPSFEEPREDPEVEASWQIEDHIPEATDDETDGDVDDVESQEHSWSQVSHARLRLDEPQKIQDIFYSPTIGPSTHSAPNTKFLKNEKLAGFGFGSPCGRQIQRLDPRNTFYTSTPPHFGGFSTSTPHPSADHRKDTWADFF